MISVSTVVVSREKEIKKLQQNKKILKFNEMKNIIEIISENVETYLAQ